MNTASASHASQVALAVAFLMVCGLIAAWDIFAVTRLSWQDTVSFVIAEWSVRFPVLPFALGMLAGHIFWPQHPISH